MDFNQLYNQLIEDFDLEQVPSTDREAILFEISKTIQKQFLLDAYDMLGEEKFSALQASAAMGEEFYATTLKHVLPNYEEIFQASREKVKKAFSNSK